MSPLFWYNFSPKGRVTENKKEEPNSTNFRSVSAESVKTPPTDSSYTRKQEIFVQCKNTDREGQEVLLAVCKNTPSPVTVANGVAATKTKPKISGDPTESFSRNNNISLSSPCKGRVPTTGKSLKGNGHQQQRQPAAILPLHYTCSLQRPAQGYSCSPAWPLRRTELSFIHIRYRFRLVTYSNGLY